MEILFCFKMKKKCGVDGVTVLLLLFFVFAVLGMMMYSCTGNGGTEYFGNIGKTVVTLFSLSTVWRGDRGDRGGGVEQHFSKETLDFNRVG